MPMTALPPAPSRSNPATFADRGDAMMAALPGFVSEANALEANVVAKEAAATAAAAAAVPAAETAVAAALTAVNAPGTSATSSTSLTVGTGSKSMTVQTGKNIVAGMSVKVASSANGAIWMAGDVISYNSSTGTLVVLVGVTQGAGTFSSWVVSLSAPMAQTSKLSYSARTANVQLTAAEIGTLIDVKSGTFTQTFDAAATLGAGWWCYIRNSGSGDITLDPNGSETIDGLATLLMPPGKWVLVQSDGSNLYVAAENAVDRTLLFTTKGTSTWTKVNGLKFVDVTVVGGGGGGSGGRGTAFYGAGGGGGGASRKRIQSSVLGATEIVTVGAGGAGGAGNLGAFGYGASGGSSSFGAHASATGGSGGSSITAILGGVGSGGDDNILGGSGGYADVANTTSGVGGFSIFGAGAAARGGSGDGTSARVYGGGGSGALDTASYAKTGGSGYQGIVIVKETY